MAVIGNLYAHNDERNPWFKAFATGAIVNNVVYDPGGLIDSQDDVEGYPTATPTRRALDVPADVDAWLEELARSLE